MNLLMIIILCLIVVSIVIIIYFKILTRPKMKDLETFEYGDNETKKDTINDNKNALNCFNSYIILIESSIKYLEKYFFQDQKDKKSIIFLLAIQVYRNLNSMYSLLVNGYYEEVILLSRVAYEKLILVKYLSENNEKLKRYYKNQHIPIESLADEHPEWNFNSDWYNLSSDFIHSNYPCTQYQINHEKKMLRIQSMYDKNAFQDCYNGIVALTINYMRFILNKTNNLDHNKDMLQETRRITLEINKYVKGSTTNKSPPTSES